MTTIASLLREGTAEKHRETEQVPYMKAIFRGGLDPQTYTNQLVNLLHVYTLMEALFTKHKADPIVSQVYFPELFRENSLKEDIQFFQKQFGTKVNPEITPATQAYKSHIQKIADTQPALLVAQSYVRYLGDLSGGQIIKKMIVKSFGLTGSDGTAFYEFPDIADHNAFKGMYREKMDTLPMNESEIQNLISEAKITFDLNKNLFQELDSDLKQNLGIEKYEELFQRGN
ncbi:MAG: biliverdin-producing heme oxygenase [Leptospira sp.]|nr:biliverdin-producing heme oxygenase [Leptospira sp.]